MRQIHKPMPASAQILPWRPVRPETTTRRLLDSSGLYRQTLLDQVRSAKQELLLEFYIFKGDEFGNELLRELTEAAERGVEVRLLIDGFGSEEILDARLQHLSDLPFEIRIYHPVPWSVLGLQHLLRLPRDWLAHLGTFNRRDHRKLVVADKRLAIFGSHNICEESLLWHEASLLLDDAPGVDAMRDSFIRIWQRSSDLSGRRQQGALRKRLAPPNRLRADESDYVLDNSTLRRSRKRNRTILRMIRGARKRLWITTPYLCPHRSVMRAIKARARAGVDVRMILPSLSDITVSRWIAQTLYSELLRSGVKLHEFQKGVLHAKTMVVDDEFLLGSSNLNHRSFLQDLELDYHGSDPYLLSGLVQWKLSALHNSLRIRDVSQIRFYWLKRGLAYLLNPMKIFF